MSERLIDSSRKPFQTAELLNNSNPIDALNQESKHYENYKQIFMDLQGGVIKNYGRDYSLYIFIRFNKNQQNEIKQWIQAEIANSVTSTWAQLNDTEDFKLKKQQDPSFSGTFCKNFFLSYKGYRTIGLDPADPNSADLSHAEAEANTLLNDSQFVLGMKEDWIQTYRVESEPEQYWYNPPSLWDIGRDQGTDQDQIDIDALILLAHDSIKTLKNEAETLLSQFEAKQIGEVVACEAGHALRDKTKITGPFGFADGISQPLFLKGDYDKYSASQDHQVDLWDPQASLSLVLVKDPFGAEYSFGSYCVVKKLETNLALFEQQVSKLTKTLGINDPERAGALMIGRFKDGTPIALTDQPSPSNDNAIANNFDYADDHNGAKCPLHAHIRKVNPRQDRDKEDITISPQDRKTRNRIFRAGITYFDPPEIEAANISMAQRCFNQLDYLAKLSQQSFQENLNSISGLLFVCFQSSISEQFSTLQRRWADEREFPRERETGQGKYLDPIIGHPANSLRQDLKNPPDPQEWPNEWNGDQFSAESLWGCVQERGGEFFFAPSISFLKNL